MCVRILIISFSVYAVHSKFFRINDSDKTKDSCSANTI